MSGTREKIKLCHSTSEFQKTSGSFYDFFRRDLILFESK